MVLIGNMYYLRGDGLYYLLSVLLFIENVKMIELLIFIMKKQKESFDLNTFLLLNCKVLLNKYII